MQCTHFVYDVYDAYDVYYTLYSMHLQCICYCLELIYFLFDFAQRMNLFAFVSHYKSRNHNSIT